MHLYLGLKSLLKVHVTSQVAILNAFTWMTQLSNFRCLLQAKDPSAPIHNACCIPILLTLYPLSVESFSLPFLHCLANFSRPFLVCEANFSLSLCLSCSAYIYICIYIYMAHFSHPVLVGLANFFHLHLFFCPPTVV